MSLRGSLLHVGCGGEVLPFWAVGEDLQETRLDTDPRHNPDFIASMTDMGDIGQYDIVFPSHCLEHVYPHEAKQALLEMRRVLVDGGVNMVIVPDLEDVKPTKDTVYECGGNKVCGLDIIYGHAIMLETNPYMAHKTGFTVDLLKEEFKEAGFKNITGMRIDVIHSIMVIGKK